MSERGPRGPENLSRVHLRRLLTAGVVLLAGTGGGVILAQPKDSGDTRPESVDAARAELIQAKNLGEACKAVESMVQAPGAKIEARLGEGSFEHNGRTITVTNPARVMNGNDAKQQPFEVLCGFGEGGATALLPQFISPSSPSPEAFTEAGSEIQSKPVVEVTVDKADFTDGEAPQVTGTYLDGNGNTVDVVVGAINEGFSGN